MVVILFGVSGAGKSVVGQLLAKELGWRFCEADDFHSPSNIDKMRNGLPLTDEDRRPWLESLRELITRSVESSEDVVLACSALKKIYRKQLRVSADVKLVYLRGDYDLIERQLRRRRGHFMKASLLKTQCADLEEPHPGEAAAIIMLGRSPSELVQEIKRELRLPPAKISGNKVHQ